MGSAFNADGKLVSSGFEIPRLVFTYPDYILYRDRNDQKLIDQGLQVPKGWYFEFRNSIEHFYPQNPHNEQGDKAVKWDDPDLNGFGNLALISVKGNSKFSNLSPESKIKEYQAVRDQSLKLIIMSKQASAWDQDKAEKHGEEMVALLWKEVDEKKNMPD